MKRAAGLVLVLTFSVLWLGCAGDSSSSSSTSTPTPTLISISPTTASPGGSSFTMTATGTNFIPPSGGQCGSEICFNGSLQSTTFVDSTQITATIPAALIAQGGLVPVFIVSNCEVASNTLTFNIGPCTLGVTGRASVDTSGAQATGASEEPDISGNGRFVIFDSDAADLVTGDTNVAQDIFLRDTCFGVTGCTPSTIRVSVDSGGAQGNGNSGTASASDDADASVNDDGRFVVFRSEATNLVTGDGNGTTDVFLRDTCIGATSCTPSTIRVSVDSSGAEGNGFSGNPSISSSGRFMVFESLADNLVTGDTNFANDIFLRDTCIGATSCTPSTIRVSESTGGTEGNLSSDGPRVSGTGRFVAFQSLADNLVTGDGNVTSDAFLRDTCMGATSCTPSTIRLSVTTGGLEGNGFSEEAFVSDGGRFVTFGSFSTNLVPGDTNGASDVFLRDTCIGAMSCTPSTIAVSVSTGGALGNLDSFAGRINATGRFVAYDSDATNLVTGDTNGFFDVFLRDTCAGVTGCTPSTIRLSVDSSGAQGNAGSADPFLSDNGAVAVFHSDSTNLVSGDTNGTSDVFITTTCF